MILVSWDGAADWVIDKLLAEGKLPNVARLVASGVRAEASRPAWPSKTACGHAAIWTGAYSDGNGISGNWVPRLPKAEHTLLEDQSGYHSTGLTAEPLWISAARAGKGRRAFGDAYVSRRPRSESACRRRHSRGATQDFQRLRIEVRQGHRADRQGPAPGWRAAAEWGVPAAGAPGTREFVLDVATSRFYGLVFDDPSDPVKGLDTLLIRQGSRDPKAAIAESTIRLREASTDIDGLSQRFPVENGVCSGSRTSDSSTSRPTVRE